MPTRSRGRRNEAKAQVSVATPSQVAESGLQLTLGGRFPQSLLGRVEWIFTDASVISATEKGRSINSKSVKAISVCLSRQNYLLLFRLMR